MHTPTNGPNVISTLRATSKATPKTGTRAAFAGAEGWPSTRRVLASSLAALLSGAAIAQTMTGAPGSAPASPAANAPTGTPAAAPRGDKPEFPKPGEGRFIQRSLPREWMLRVQLTVMAAQARTGTGLPAPASFQFQTVALVWPFVLGTSNSDLKVDQVRSSLRFDAREAIGGAFAKESTPDNPRAVLLRSMADDNMYPSGVALGRWLWERPQSASTVQLFVDIPSTSWRTTYDDRAANQVPWPVGAWPEVATSTFQPEMYINYGIDLRTGEIKPYDMKPIRDAVDRWTNKRPQDLTPARLAKLLAFQVVQAMRVTTTSYTFNDRAIAIEGLNLQGAPNALRSGAGSTMDVGTVLVAAMRECGLPARLVIGYQGEEHIRDGMNVRSRRQNERVRAWVEFCLYDEGTRTMNWVPIDYEMMKYSSSRMENFEQPWRYFGTIEYMNMMVPFALQAFPPTTVQSYGSPGFWGWNATPANPAVAYQTISFSAGRDQVKPGDGSPTDRMQRPGGR